MTNKRRRFGRRRNGSRFRRSGRRISGVSGQAGNFGSSGFRTRRTSRRQWRNLLWRETQSKQHWRSNLSASTPITTQSSPDLVDVVTAQAIGTNFWTTAGGTVPAETGVAVPGFVGDIVLRGGKSTISFCNISNADTGDACRVRLWMVWTITRPEFSLVPATPVPNAWDPSMIPDFGRIGKVIGFREFWVNPGSVPMQVTFRWKPQKVDRTIHNIGGETLVYFFTINGHNTGSDTVVEQLSYNISFAADAI